MILDVLGDTIGKIFLICVVIAVTVCCLAVHTATIRMAFAMARDNNLPAGERLATVHPKTKTPIVPAVITGVLAILILVVNIRQPQIFTVITSIGIIMIYIAYLLVTVPMLRKRLRGRVAAARTPGRGATSPSASRAADQRRRGGLGHLHGDQPGLAAQGRLQRDRAVPLVPPVRRRSCSSASCSSAGWPTTGSCSATRPACSQSHAAIERALPEPRSRVMHADVHRRRVVRRRERRHRRGDEPGHRRVARPGRRGRPRGRPARDRRGQRGLPGLGGAHGLRARRAAAPRRRRVRAAARRAGPHPHARPGQAAQGRGRGRGRRAGRVLAHGGRGRQARGGDDPRERRAGPARAAAAPPARGARA